MLLIYLTLAWVLGVVIADRATPQGNLILAILVFAGLSWLVFRRERGLRLVLGLLLFFALGMLRLDTARPESNADHIMHLNDRGQLTLEGIVIDEAQERDTALQILIEADQAAGHAVEGRVLVQVPRESDVRYGDEVRLFGVLRSAAEFDTFSYRDYLARQNVFSVMYNADVEVLSRDNGVWWRMRLLDFKQDANQFIKQSLPEPHASLLTGILLGDESGISEDVEADFTRAGASHIIAISGFNMAILAGVLMAVLGNLLPNRKLTAAMLGIAAIIVYTLFVGAGATVVRAAVMSSVLIWGQSIQRKTYVPTSLTVVALLMSILDPWVLWDVGFQLSLAAVMGIALFVPPLERLLERGLSKIAGRQVFKIFSESFIVTLAAQITTTPIILYYFGRLSLVSLAVNFLIIPIQTPLLITGAIGTLIGLVVPQIGELILQATWIFLAWTVWVVETFADVSWADTNLSISQAALLAFFVGLIVFVLYWATRPRWAMRLVGGVKIPVYLMQGAGIIVLVLLVSAASQKPDGRLHVTFLDVENGNGVLIQSPDGAVILVDGGSLPSRLLDQLGDHLPARQRTIDVLILTSPYEENIAALPEVLERYEVGTILTNGQAGYAPLDERITELGIPITTVTAGYELTTDDGLQIEVLNPLVTPADDAEPDMDALVLRVTYQQAVFLLTADIGAQTENTLIEHPHLLQATVLQVPAHGSGNASSVGFIEVVHPQAAVIQLDEANPNGNPSPTVIDRLSEAQLFRTDQNGTIEIITDGRQLWIQTETDS